MTNYAGYWLTRDIQEYITYHYLHLYKTISQFESKLCHCVNLWILLKASKFTFWLTVVTFWLFLCHWRHFWNTVGSFWVYKFTFWTILNTFLTINDIFKTFWASKELFGPPWSIFALFGLLKTFFEHCGHFQQQIANFKKK